MTSTDAKVRKALDEMCKLVGTKVRLGAWDRDRDGALDCVGMSIEYARVIGQPISWALFQHPGTEKYETHWYADPGLRGFSQFDNFKDTTGREVPFEERRAGDVIVVRLRGLPHIGIYLGYDKWLYPAGVKGISIGRFNDFWKRRLICTLRPHVFNEE